MRRGLFLFTNDLRLHDQPALSQLAAQVDELLLVFCLDPSQRQPGRYQQAALGEHRLRFLRESLRDLQHRLAPLGQRLTTLEGSPLSVLPKLIADYDIALVASSLHNGIDEQRQWQRLQQLLQQRLQQRSPGCRFLQANSHSLFDAEQLPFPPQGLPDSFSKFRRRVEALSVPVPQTEITALPPPPAGWRTESRAGHSAAIAQRFIGGETAALAQLEDYFSSDKPHHYKATRNALWGWDNSTKFSAWLANGCLSPRQLWARLKSFEAQHGASESSYWIGFELLWREFFHCYARRHGVRLFTAQGIKDSPPLTSFYPGRFKQWCAGRTPYPIVNACMRELNATGYMSNRGRQLVASCFVHELGLDWRYGAAYFQRQLIDYDVASNWGNWQYLAGVGADPRGHRRFDLDKQARQYDPDGSYRQHWLGEDADANLPLDHVDMVDWPLPAEGGHD